MQSPVRIYSGQRLLTCRNESKQSLLIKTKQSKKQLLIDNLNQQLIYIKQQRNQLFEENKTLKQKIQHFEKQLNKQEKILMESRQLKNDSKDIEQQIRIKTEEACSVIAYQKQIKDFEIQNKINQEIIQELKKDTRRTKLQEIQIECKVIKEEYDKLKYQYQALIHQIQLNSKDKIIQDNIKLSQEMLILQSELKELQLKFKKSQQDLHLAEFSKTKNEKQLFEKEKELQLVQFEFSNPKKTISDLNKQWQVRLDNQRTINQQLDEELKQKLEKINLLEKSLKEDKSAYQIKEAYLKREIDNLNIQITQLKETIASLEKEQFLEESSDAESPSISIQQPSLRKTSQTIGGRSRTMMMSKKKIQKVNYYNVENIGKELSLKLQLNQIPFTRIDSYIYSKSSKGIINLSEIQDILKQQPFELDDNQSNLVARFLAEPEQEEWIYYDNQQENDVVIVISIFKNLIKQYELVNPEEYSSVEEQLKQILKINKQKLIDYLILNGEICDLQQFKKAFEYCDIQLNQIQDNYLSVRIYEKFKKINNFKYLELIEIFK